MDNHVISGSDFDMDKWYNYVQPFTAPSYFVPLTEVEINSIILFYRMEMCSHSVTEDELVCLKSLKDIALKIEDIMRTGNGWFIRLNTRSPKDGIPASGIKPCNTANIDTNCDDKLLLNENLVDFLRGEVVKVKNSFEALHLLCSSERIFRDLQLTKKFGLSNQIILRTFDERIDDHWEFRCFVYNKELTAISQYNPYIFDAALPDQQDCILHTISQFFQQHIQTNADIVWNNYVMDVALCPAADGQHSRGGSETADTHSYDTILIEFNAYDKFTGPSLFDWKEDRQILEHTPTTIRVRTEPYEKVGHILEMYIAGMDYLPKNGELKHSSFLKLPKYEARDNRGCTMS